MQDKIRIIKFKNVGNKRQHKVTLFEMAEKDLILKDFQALIDSYKQSGAEERLAHYHSQAKAYLKAAGYDNPSGNFRLENGKVVECDHLWQSLWAVIQERDQDEQTEDYLAALIEHNCRMVLRNWPPEPKHYSAVLDAAMLIQDLFINLFILKKIHPQYSAGRSRTNEANEERNLQRFKPEAEKIYREYREKGRKKEDCYKSSASRLLKNHPELKTPTAGTIKSWFKSRKDLP